MEPSKPKRLAITMGDPAGIGPEVILKAVHALLSEDASWSERLELHGEWKHFESISRKLAHGELAEQLSRLVFIESSRQVEAIELGRVSAASGHTAYQAIQSALSGVKAGRLAGLVTAPISKKALNLAGHAYPGHTEMLAEAAGNVPVRMMLANEELAVVLVSIHLPLKQALMELSTEAIVETIEITDSHFRRTRSRAPTLAVAGLNPHAGEEGLLGREEIELIEPAIAQCRGSGIDVSGPYPPDTVFMQARRSRRFDAVIAQYHDQGLIPVKYLGVEHGVNITLGLPFIRTSPDHGTATDIAGQGIADPSSMIAAIRKADALCRERES